MTARQPLPRGDPRVAGRHCVRREAAARPTAGLGTRASVSRMSLRDAFGKDVLLTGWGHSRFGKLDDETLESLIVRSPPRPWTPGSSRARSTRSTSASSTPG